MPDSEKTKKQLISELKAARRRIEDLEPVGIALKRAEETCRVSETRIRSITDAVRDAILMIDPDGRVTFWNPAAERLLGYPGEEALGQDLHLLIAPERYHAAYRDAFPRFRLSGQGNALNKTVELFARRRDGAEIPISLSLSALNIQGDWHAIGILRDITDRKKAEETLKHQQQILELILEQSLAGYWDWMIQDGTEYLSPTFKGMFGYADHELENSPDTWQRLIFPEDLPGVFEVFQRHIESRGAFPYYNEVRYRHKDGSTVWVICTGKVIEWGDQGQAIRMVGCHIDITDRKMAEEKLKLSEKKYRTLYDGMRDGLAVVDTKGSIIEFNKSFMGMIKYDEHEIYNITYNDITPERWHGMESDILKNQVLQRGFSDVYEKEYRRKDGTVFPVSIRTYVIHGMDGEVEGFWALVRDITWRKNAESKLVQAKETAESATKAKSEFLANMSHEIRTPINGVLGMLQLLELTPLDEEQKEHVDLALQSGINLLNLINDILDFSKIEAGKIEIFKTLFSLPDLCRSIPSIFKDQTSKKGLSLTIEIAPDVPNAIFGDIGRIRQVLFNLIGNAVKFTEMGGIKVLIEADENIGQAERWIRFSTSDTGIGIPEDLIPELFEPFTQIDGTLTRNYQGTGLGLSIVKRLVSLMGGDVRMESKVGQGTTVRFDIPVGVKAEDLPSKSDVMPQATTNLSQAQTHPLKLKILLAEDEIISQGVAGGLLKKMGATVVCTNNGEEALEALRKERFDLVLMDVQMPIMDGVTATRSIRAAEGADYQQIPIIALTAHALTGDKELLLKAGMDDYISKPVDKGQLQQVIARVMSRKKVYGAFE